MAQDIYPAISGNAVNNGGISVLNESRSFSDLDVSYTNESLPNMSTISGKYDSRFTNTADSGSSFTEDFAMYSTAVRVPPTFYRGATGIMTKIAEANCSSLTGWTCNLHNIKSIDSGLVHNGAMVNGSFVLGGINFTKTGVTYANQKFRAYEFSTPGFSTTDAWMYAKIILVNPSQFDKDGGQAPVLTALINEVGLTHSFINMPFISGDSVTPGAFEVWTPIMSTGNNTTGCNYIEFNMYGGVTQTGSFSIAAFEFWKKPPTPVVMLCLDDFIFASYNGEILVDRLYTASYANSKNVPLSLVVLSSGLSDSGWRTLQEYEMGIHCCVNGTHQHKTGARNALADRVADVTECSRLMRQHGLHRGSRCLVMPGVGKSHPWSLVSDKDLLPYTDIILGDKVAAYNATPSGCFNHLGQYSIGYCYPTNNLGNATDLAICSGWVNSAKTYNNILCIDVDLAVGGFTYTKPFIDFLAAERDAGRILIKTLADYAYNTIY